MRAPIRIRVVVTSALSLALIASGALVGIGLAGGNGEKTPDLYPLFPVPGHRTNGDGAPDRWFDSVVKPGRLLYRFDTVIMNKSGSGALDVFRRAGGSAMVQVLWPGPSGVPSANVTPTTALPSPAVDDVTLNEIPGESITYSDAAGHNHFHAPRVAAYSLWTKGSGGAPGTLVSNAAKNTAGFCLYDSWGAGGAKRYANGALCRPNEPNFLDNPAHSSARWVRMGISPGDGDFYGSQLADQWVDVTAAQPGDYVLLAEVDPDDLYREDANARGNNRATEIVTIPGAVVTPPAPRTTQHNTAISFNLTGQVKGASVRVRDSASCSTSNPHCMSVATQALTYSRASGAGAAGDAVVTSGGQVTFTPADGFAGTASFTVRAKDSRGLGGAAVPVTIQVAGAPAVTVEIDPPSASVDTGSTRKFEANLTNGTGSVRWSVNGVNGGNATLGTISDAGLYSAPASVPAGGVVTLKATHVASSASASAQVTVTQAAPDPEVRVTLSPGSATLTPGATLAFDATVDRTTEDLAWSVDGVPGGNETVGTITNNGVYTAPAASPGYSLTVRATAPSSGAVGEAYINVSTPQNPDPQDPDPQNPDPKDPETPVPGPSTPPSTPTVPPPATPPGGSVDVIPPTPRSTKAPVVLRPTFALQSRRGKVYLRARGVASRSQAGRKVAIQRVVNRRLVTISRAKVNERGRFTAMVRVPTRGELSVRAVLGSTRTTRAAKSDVTRLRARWRSASERRDRVVIRPTFMLLARDGGVHLETRGTVDRRLAGRTVAVQRIRGQRIVTIARARVDRRGRYHTSVRVPSAGALDVRVTVGATARTTAARSPMVAVRLAGGGA